MEIKFNLDTVKERSNGNAVHPICSVACEISKDTDGNLKVSTRDDTNDESWVPFEISKDEAIRFAELIFLIYGVK